MYHSGYNLSIQWSNLFNYQTGLGLQVYAYIASLDMPEVLLLYTSIQVRKARLQRPEIGVRWGCNFL